MKSPEIYHIIVAAGSGSRFGAAIPKQFCPLLGRPVLMETIERFRRFGHSGEIFLVLHPDWVGPWLEMCRQQGFQSPRIINGGATRWESVRNAITELPDEATIVTVHDGARPVVTAEIIDAALESVTDGAPGAIPVIDVTDSLRMTMPDGSSSAVDRAKYKAVQTPQAFNARLLREAYHLPYSPSFTDDASVMETAFPGCRLALTPGDPNNIKITHMPDLERVASYIKSQSDC